jgi:hypothetical protein
MFTESVTASMKEKFGYTSLKIEKLERWQIPDQWSHFYLRKGEVSKSNDSKPDNIPFMKY